MKHFSFYIIILFTCIYAQRVCAQEIQMPVEGVPADSLAVADSLGLQQDSLPQVVLTYPQILTDMPNVRVEQDSLITLLMEEKFAGVQRGEHEMPGFRVQIYSSNHPTRGKAEALLLEQRVKQALSVPVYVIYDTPSWKVRLGDFLTEQQAVDFRNLFKQFFPDLADYTYIVRDQIKIR